MNGEIESKLTGYMDKAEGVAIDAYELLIEQSPLIAEEVVRWHFYNGVVSGIVALVFAMAGVVISYCVYKCIKQATEEEEFAIPVAALTACIIVVLPAMLSFDFFRDAVKAKVAPRIVIIDYIKDSAQ